MAIEKQYRLECDWCKKEIISANEYPLPNQWLRARIAEWRRNNLEDIENIFCCEKCAIKFFNKLKKLEFKEKDC